jgi:succinyl-CoA synthetase beta subunit
LEVKKFPIKIFSGMSIEEVDKKYIKQFPIDPAVGLTDALVRDAFDAFVIEDSMRADCERAVRGLYRCFAENDSTLVEVNPFATLDDGRLLVCDTKVRVDDNAQFRHKELFAMDDLTQKDAREVEAAKYDLNYVKLGGNVGCMVNGAGLAMATMDFINFAGGSPANFLDVGGGTTVDRVYQAVKLIDSDPSVNSILVNIFGGIVRCDVIVEGLLKAMVDLKMTKPIVMRLKGTNSGEAEKMVKESGMALYWETNLKEAVEKVVSLSK